LFDWLNTNVTGIATFENQNTSDEIGSQPLAPSTLRVSFELESDLAMFLVRFS